MNKILCFLHRLGNHAVTLAIVLSLALPLATLEKPRTAYAAASISMSTSGSVLVGEALNINIYVNTGGASANAFDVTLKYPAGMFEGTRGSMSGSVCNLTISSPTPSGGTATITCGTTGGYTGSGLLGQVVLTATQPGPASFSLTQCQVLANDENGSTLLDAGSCGGGSTTVSPKPVVQTPPPGSTGGTTTTVTTTTAVPSKKPVATPTKTPSANPKNNTTPQPADSPKAPDPVATPSVPPAEPIPSSAPTPVSTASATTEEAKAGSQRRTISEALRDLFTSFKDLRKLTGNLTGVIALVLAMIPVLLLVLAIVYFLYRLYILERRRRRTLDRLFEMELSELAALEGKLDLLADKGAKGREEYREEFRKTKESILRQLHPDFNKPVEQDKKKPDSSKAAPAAAPATPAPKKS